MKKTFTLFSILLSSLAHAQLRQPAVAAWPLLTRLAPHAHAHVPPGPGAILDRQCASLAHSKTTAIAYRLTGWSRYDPATGAVSDSSRSTYSGGRGSRFIDEYQNWSAGNFWTNSSPDLFINISFGPGGQRIGIDNQYDAADRVTQSIYRMNGWTSKSVSTYDGAGRLTRLTEYDSAAGGWIAQRLYLYSYDAAGRRTKDSVVSISDNEPLGVVRYHYDAAGRQDTMESRQWNGVAFFTDYMMVNTYDAAGNIASNTTFMIDEALALQPSVRMLYTYTTGARLQLSLTSVYDNGGWTDRQRDTFGYTGAKPLYTYLRTDSRDGATGPWMPLREYVYSLDGQNRWQTLRTNEPDPSGGTLLPATQLTFEYNAAGLVSATKRYDYDAATGTYGPHPFEAERFQYESYQATAVKTHASRSDIRLFPNPAGSSLQLECAGAAIESATILSAAGQRVNELSVRGRARQIDLSALPSGMYLLLVRLEGEPEPRPLRFVKQ